MLINSGLFVILLTALQVSARYKAVIINSIENEINPESASSSRIVGGWEARPGEIPYYVALHRVTNIGGVGRCGGAIASKEWVITAALCFRNLQSLTVRFGLSFDNPDYTLETTEWYTHPSYNLESTATQPNDIALVKLPHPVVYTNLVKPIRVQSSANAYRDYAGEQVSLSGHGRTSTNGPFSDELRWVYLRAVSNTECAGTFGTSLVVDTTICTSFFNDTSQSPCNGDAGSPLVQVGSDGIPTLIGIWSFMRTGDNACNSGLPFGYTRPGPYLPWFKEVTGLDFENLQEDTITTTTPDPTTTTEVITTTTTDPAEQEPEYTTPEGTATPPDDSGEGDDSESGQDDDIAQLLKRLQVSVKVKVRMDKFNTTKAVGMEVDQKHRAYPEQIILTISFPLTQRKSERARCSSEYAQILE